jgi:gluconokinase
MGVSGCGKSTVGAAAAAHLGWRFVEGDSLHPPENVTKMAAGQALDDEDRAGWLDTLAAQLAQARRTGQGLVVSCSALKRAYRDRLRGGDPDTLFVYLAGEQSLIASRMAARQHQYMPASLLQSQFATLQPPDPDEHALRLSILEAPAQITQSIARHLQVLACPTT